jgi:hypothetical protein
MSSALWSDELSARLVTVGGLKVVLGFLSFLYYKLKLTISPDAVSSALIVTVTESENIPS